MRLLRVLSSLLLAVACARPALAIDDKCEPNSAEPVLRELYRKFGLSGKELADVSGELARTESVSSDTIRRYRTGDAAYRYALIAQAAYDFGKGAVDWDSDGKPDWVIGHVRESYSGFAAAAYRPLHPENAGGVELIIAYRGTDDLRDWVAANLPALILPLDVQVPAATRFARRAIKKYQIDASKVVVVGHSLGGRLAQLVAAQYGLKAYTFNAAVPKDLLPFTDVLKPKAPIVSIVSAADIVNPATELLGRSRDLGEVFKFEFCGPGQGHALGGMLGTLYRVSRVYREKLMPIAQLDPPPQPSLDR